MQFLALEVFIYLHLFMVDYRVLLVSVTDRACLRIAIPTYCFNIFRSTIGLLFCLLDIKLILGSKPI